MIFIGRVLGDALYTTYHTSFASTAFPPIFSIFLISIPLRNEEPSWAWLLGVFGHEFLIGAKKSDNPADFESGLDSLVLASITA